MDKTSIRLPRLIYISWKQPHAGLPTKQPWSRDPVLRVNPPIPPLACFETYNNSLNRASQVRFPAPPSAISSSRNLSFNQNSSPILVTIIIIPIPPRSRKNLFLSQLTWVCSIPIDQFDLWPFFVSPSIILVKTTLIWTTWSTNWTSCRLIAGVWW